MSSVRKPPCHPKIGLVTIVWERQCMRVIEWCLLSFQDSTLQVIHIHKLGWDRLVIQDLRQMPPESAAERYTNTQLQDPQMKCNLHSFWNTSHRIRIDASQLELFELVSNFSYSPLQHRIRPIMMPASNFVDIRAYTSKWECGLKCDEITNRMLTFELLMT